MRAYYVTATGTDIGKTYVACQLLKAWRERGLSVAATKPVMTGYSELELGASDCGRLLSAMGEVCAPESVSAICHTRLAPPLAPNMAMRAANIRQDYIGLLQFVRRRLRQTSDRHLVEGAGGVMSPLTDTHLQIDLMADLGLPVLLVTAPYLGSVTHTLTALGALKTKGLTVACVIVSEPAETSGSDDFTREIERLQTVSCVRVARGGNAAHLVTRMRYSTDPAL